MQDVKDRGMRDAHSDEEARSGHLIMTGALATAAAVTVTTVAASVAKALGADFEMPDGGEAVPVSGVAVLTGVFSVVGVVLAAAFRRWSARPAPVFVRTTVALTACSLVPPFLVGANRSTVAALLVVHLLAASVMIPALARELRH